MSPLKRYELWQHAGFSQGGNHVDLQPMPLGQWVRYADVEALLAARRTERTDTVSPFWIGLLLGLLASLVVWWAVGNGE